MGNLFFPKALSSAEKPQHLEILLACFPDYVGRKPGSRVVPVPARPLEVVPYELLVKACLRPAGGVFRQGPEP